MLLERDAPLRDLTTALHSAAAGSGRIVLVSGEAGIGKTALVEQFTADLAGTARVLWGACDALFTPRPLGPLLDMAAQLRGDWPARLAPDAHRTTLFSAFLSELQQRPTLAVFEDVHWADEATLDLLKFLGRRIARTSALLVLTFRDDELGSRHPLRIVLGDLATSPAVQRIALRPLTEQGVQALIGARPIAATALHRQTGGNPFFVTESLAHVDAQGPGRSPQAGAAGGEGLPATIREAVLARAARLSLSGRSVLEAAAVIGPRIEAWLLAEMVGEQAPVTAECMAVGILVASGDGLAFRHELARQAVLEAISPPHRLALHRRALDVLRASPATRDDLARLAGHAAAAGDRPGVRAYAPAAARRAAVAGAHREAAALYDLALRSALGVAPDERATWLEEYAKEMHILGALEESRDIRRQAIEAWRATGNRVREGFNLARLAGVLINVGQSEEAERASQAALALLEDLPPGPELALAYRTQAHLRMLNRDCAEAVAWGNRAIELAARFDDREILAMAYTTIGAALLLTDYERGRDLLEKCFDLAQAIGWEFGAANAYANLGSISCEVMRLHSAEAYLHDGLRYTGERDLDFLGKYMLAWRALTLAYLGRWGQAHKLAGEALQGFGVTTIARIPALIALGRLRSRQGSAAPGSPLDEALELAQQSRTLQRLGLVHAARAEAAWLAGDREHTLVEARAVYDRAVAKQHPWLTGELAFWRWRAGDAVSPPDWVAGPFALQLAGNWRAAAEEWERLGCPYEQARALADGDVAAQETALAIFDQLGARPALSAVRQSLQAAGAAVPRGPRAKTRQNPFGLTARQFEVLALLAQDLTNAEIAARLHLSPKTVEHHVSTVLAKLEVGSRKAAAEWARKSPFFSQAAQ